MSYAIYDAWNRKNLCNINWLAKAAADKASLESAAESKRTQRTRKGGLSGGKACALSLPPEKRAEIAEKQLKRDGISPNPLEYLFRSAVHFDIDFCCNHLG